MEKKYLIAGGVAVVGLVAYVKLKRRAPAPQSNAGYDSPAYMYMPSSLGSGGGELGGGESVATPPLLTPSPSNALSAALSQMLQQDAVSQMAATLASTGGSGSISTVNGVTTVNVSRPNPDQNDIDFVTGAFNQILDRDPRSGGLAYYVDAINNGTSYNQVAESIRLSPENFSQEQSRITSFFNEILGRAPREEGLRHYTDALVNGVAPDQIRREIEMSPENQTQNQVAQIFQQVLHRDPRNEGLQFYTQAVMSGSRTIDQIRADIAASPEAVALQTASPATA